jgi:hypothetical protein
MKGVVFAILILLGAAPAAQAAEECGPLQLINQVQMTRLAGSNVDLVPFTINGKETHFLLDTGSSLTQIGQATAEALNLVIGPGSIEMYDIRGHASNSMAAIPQFVLGRLGGTHGIFPVAPNLDAETPDPFDGIFSLDYLQQHDVEMDFGNDLLNVFSSDHCPGHVVYWNASAVTVIPFILDDRRITIPVMLDGHRLNALIDTGTAHTSLRIDIAETQFGLNLGSPETPENGALNGDASLKTYDHTFGKLSFGDITVADPRITIIPNVAGVTNDTWRRVTRLYRVELINAPQLILGMDALRQLRIYVAFGEGKLYISHTSTPAATQAKASL